MDLLKGLKKQNDSSSRHGIQRLESEEKARVKGQFNFGIWSEKEQELYIVFVDFHRKEFKSKHLRRFRKIFKIMGLFIQSRDAIQCRSHHMKQLRSFKKVEQVIKHYKHSIGDTLYSQLFEAHKTNLESLSVKDNLTNLEEQKKTIMRLQKVHIATQTELKAPESQNSNQSFQKFQSPFLMPMMWTPFQNWSWNSH